MTLEVNHTELTWPTNEESLVAGDGSLLPQQLTGDNPDDIQPSPSPSPDPQNGEITAQPGATVTDPAQNLVARAEAGPVATLADFDDIFARFQTPITNFVYHLVNNREQAFDLTQDTFVKVFRALSAGTTVDLPGLSAWVYRIAANTARDALRRKRLIDWLSLENSATAVADFAGAHSTGRFEQQVADRDVIERVIRRMPTNVAKCLMLRIQYGLSPQEIALYLRVPEPRIKMRILRARRLFERFYRQEVGHEPWSPGKTIS